MIIRRTALTTLTAMAIAGCGGGDGDDPAKKKAAPEAKGETIKAVTACFEEIPLNIMSDSHNGEAITDSVSGSGATGGDEVRPFAIAVIAKSTAAAAEFEAAIDTRAKEDGIPAPVQESGSEGTYAWAVAGGDTKFADFAKAVDCVKP